MKILLTGSTGFIGRALTSYLLEQTDALLHLAIRKSSDMEMIEQTYNERVLSTCIGDISAGTNWLDLLIDCDVVVHCAARVHIMDEWVRDPLRAFREINVDGTLNLAQQAAQAGVRRFIYLSSIKVNGEYTQSDMPFSPDDIATPMHPYSISKFEAEQGLMRLAESSNMEVVIIRPPLVYGPGVKGNFLRMLQLLHKKLPLPFGALKKNKRSFVSVSNLINLITICLTHPNAANQIFLVSDDHDLTTVELFQKIQQTLESRSLFLPVPIWALNSAAILLGKKEEIMRICGSLQVDISKSQKLLNWQPIESVDEALHRTVCDYTKAQKNNASVLTDATML